MTIYPLYERKRFLESWYGLVSGLAKIHQNEEFEPTLHLLGDWLIGEAANVCGYLDENNNRDYDDQAYLTLEILEEVYNTEKIGLSRVFFPLAIGIKRQGSPIFGWLRSKKSGLESNDNKMYIQEGEGGRITQVSEFDHVITDATPALLEQAWRAHITGLTITG